MGSETHQYIALCRQNADIVPALRAGETFARPGDDPPWIVIHRTPMEATPTRWPCQLWRVRPVRPVEPQGHRGQYLRCHEIEAIEEESNASMFGPEGHRIVDLLDAILRLDLPQAEALVTHRHPRASELYDAAWRRWSGRAEEAGSYDRALMAPGPKGTYGSPLGRAFSLIIATLDDRASELTGGNFQETDEDGELAYLPPWSEVSGVLLETAMGLGAPHLTTPEENKALLAPWSAVLL